MKRILLTIIIAFTTMMLKAATYTVDQIPNVHLADSSQYVSNPDGIIPADDVARLNAMMREIRRTTSAEGVVVAVDNIEGGDIDTFATELFEAWGLGKSDKDNGLLILVAKDLRKAVIRPGYGLEGLLPDIFCANVLRYKMFPQFKEGNYGTGLVDGCQAISTVLLDPEARAEIMSELGDADFASDDDTTINDLFLFYLGISAIIAAIMLILLIYTAVSSRGKPRHERYMALAGLKPVYLALTFLGLGVPLVASLPLLITLYRLRNAPHKCPNCATAMRKVDEVHDNDYLNPAQDLEERIGSVDYDVWLCPACGETDIEQYVQPSSGYRQCPHCNAYAERHTRDRITRRPTTTSKGQGLHEYRCMHCGNIDLVPYLIPMIVAAPVVIGGGGHSGGFGGGGSFGGGFGGGHTGGGGASGGW